MNDSQADRIYSELIELNKTVGEIKGHTEASEAHLARINGTLDSHAGDIQSLQTADAITKASTVKFRWFLGVLIPIVAIAASAWFKLG